MSILAQDLAPRLLIMIASPMTRSGVTLPPKYPLLVVVALLTLATGLRAQVSINVLQTNIHRDIGGSDSNMSSQPYLAQEINFLNPDVWTLQELGGNNVSYNATTAYNDLVAFVQSDLTIFGASPAVGVNFYVYLSTRNDGYDTSAIVSRYPILSSQTYSDAGGGNSALRGLARVTLDIPGSTNLDIFTTHLKALSTDSDAQKRMSEADVDSATIASWIAAHPTDAIVATGDWNETVESGASANWSGHALGDSVTLTNGVTEVYNPVAKIKAAGLTDPRPVSIKGNVNTISSTKPNARFDYVMFAGNANYVSGQVFDTKQYTSLQLTALNGQFGTNFTSSTSANASDHLAVFATFAIVPEPGTLSLLGVAIVVIVWRGRRT